MASLAESPVAEKLYLRRKLLNITALLLSAASSTPSSAAS